jgi:ankyrin repeat protein
VFEFFRNFGANIYTTVAEAAQNGHLKILKLILDQDDNLDLKNRALRIVSLYGHFEAVKYLLDVGADISAENNSPFLRAASYGHLDVTNLLLSRGADPAANDNLAIGIAASCGHVKIVELILNHGGKITPYAISKAKENGHTDILKLFSDRAL